MAHGLFEANVYCAEFRILKNAVDFNDLRTCFRTWRHTCRCRTTDSYKRDWPPAMLQAFTHCPHPTRSHVSADGWWGVG